MWELDYKESWAPKNWRFWTVVLEKTLESLLDCKEIWSVHPKGNQSWIFTGRTDAEAETPILWPPDAKNWLIWKDPDAGKSWRQEEKGTTGWDYCMASPTLWTLSLSKLRVLVMDREAWHAAVHGVSKHWTWLSNWTELNWSQSMKHCWKFYPGLELTFQKLLIPSPCCRVSALSQQCYWVKWHRRQSSALGVTSPGFQVCLCH